MCHGVTTDDFDTLLSEVQTATTSDDRLDASLRLLIWARGDDDDARAFYMDEKPHTNGPYTYRGSATTVRYDAGGGFRAITPRHSTSSQRGTCERERIFALISLCDEMLEAYIQLYVSNCHFCHPRGGYMSGAMATCTQCAACQTVCNTAWVKFCAQSSRHRTII